MVLGFGDSDVDFARRRAFPTYGDHYLVAGAHPMVVEAGLKIANAGGNAFDSAVAAGLAAAVVMPEMCGLGGELFTVFTVKGGNPISLQASGRSARGASYELMKEVGGDQMPYTGPHSLAVPGMVSAYFELLDKYGTMSFAQVVEPAIDLARNGYALQPLGAQAIASTSMLLTQDPAAASVFLVHGNAPKAGDRIVQTDLANTLEQLGKEGVESFYSGDIVRRMVAYLQSVGSAFTLEDFAAYESDHSAPYSLGYRGHTVYQTALPSQGIILLESLNIVSNGDLRDPQSAHAIHAMVEAKKLAYADRLAHLGEGAGNPIEMLLSKPFGKQRYDEIDPSKALQDVPVGALSDGDTTYLCTADADGNMVSLIQSVSSSFGAGIVAGDTGVVMNNRSGRGFSLDPAHPNVYAPGKKSMHTLNCYLIEDEAGTPVMVGGTPGGDGQPQWNLQALAGMFDAGMDVQTAIEQPRWTSWPGTDPAGVHNPFELRMESRVAESVRDDLESRGHTVVVQPEWGGGGSMQIIARDPESGLLIGGTDARTEGTVLGR